MTIRTGFDTTKNKDTLRGARVRKRKATTKRGASGVKKKKAKRTKRKSYSY